MRFLKTNGKLDIIHIEGGEKSMAYDLIPRNFWRFPTVAFPSMMEDFEDLLPTGNLLNGLSVSEDDKNVYVEAAVPGVDPKEVDVTFDKETVTVRAEKKEEEKGKKFQRKATSSFYYRVMPADVDPKATPTAVCKNGVMKITFTKALGAKPKKIAVKSA